MTQRQIRKNLIAEVIEVFEEGRFQEFCLRFFPLYSNEYEGLYLHGGTPNGKTRKGTPDLVKTENDGRVIIIECGTQKDYWHITKDIEKWKPIIDLNKCLTEFRNYAIHRICFCCSRDFPANYAMAPAALIKYAKEKEIYFELESWPKSRFIEEIVNHINRYRILINEFFHDLADILYITEESATAIKVHRLYKESGKPYDLIYDIVSNSPHRDYTELKNIIFQKSRSHYEKNIQPFEGIRRNISWESICNYPIGKIISILGAPKIGKTYLVNQLINELPKTLTIRWFDVPIRKEDQRYFANDVNATILSVYFDEFYVTEYIYRFDTIDSLLQHQKTKPINTLIIIDNAENFQDDTIQSLKDNIAVLESNLVNNNLGIIFITARSLKKYLICGKEFTSPLWTSNEIESFLTLKAVPIANDIKDYIKVLYPLSHGHPLIAFAIAKKCPSITQLISEIGSKRDQPLYDEVLSSRIKNFMFEQLLIDPEEMQTVLRASALIYSFEKEDIEYLNSNLRPMVKRPIKLILENLWGSIFEGNIEANINVASIFKDVANSVSSKEDLKEIYALMGKRNTRLTKKTINAVKFCRGIIYYLLSGQMEKALYFTGFMLSWLFKDEVKNYQIKIIIDYLDVIAYLEPPEDELSLKFYLSNMPLFRMAYIRLDDNKQANYCRDQMGKALRLKYLITDIKFLNLTELLYHVSCFIDYARDSNYDKALEELDKLIIPEGKEFESLLDGLMLLLSDAIKGACPIKAPMAFLSRAILLTNVTNNDRISNLISCFISLAVKMKNKEKESNEMIMPIRNLSELGDIMYGSFMAQYYSDKGENENALDEIDRVHNLAVDNGYTWGAGFIYLIVLSADLNYNLEREKEAAELYIQSLSLLSSDQEFYIAWCNYKLGCIEKSGIIAVDYLEKAARLFHEIEMIYEYSRAIGEMAILKYKMGQRVEALELFSHMIKQYYIENKMELGPAVMVSSSLLGNILKNDTPLEEHIHDDLGMVQLGFIRGVYSQVPMNAKPIASKALVYFTLGSIYEKININIQAKKYFRYVLTADLSNDIELFAYVKAAFFVGSSFVEKATIHLQGLDKILENELGIKRALKYGFNIYTIWAVYVYRRISISDIIIFNRLHESAVELSKTGLTQDEIGACMLQILLHVLGKQDEAKYQYFRKECNTITIPALGKLSESIRLMIR